MSSRPYPFLSEDSLFDCVTLLFSETDFVDSAPLHDMIDDNGHFARMKKYLIHIDEPSLISHWLNSDEASGAISSTSPHQAVAVGHAVVFTGPDESGLTHFIGRLLLDNNNAQMRLRSGIRAIAKGEKVKIVVARREYEICFERLKTRMAKQFREQRFNFGAYVLNRFMRR